MENKPCCYRTVRKWAFAQVNTELVATHNNQADRGSRDDAGGLTSYEFSVLNLLGDGASRTYERETEMRCS